MTVNEFAWTCGRRARDAGTRALFCQDRLLMSILDIQERSDTNPKKNVARYECNAFSRQRERVHPKSVGQVCR